MNNPIFVHLRHLQPAYGRAWHWSKILEINVDEIISELYKYDNRPSAELNPTCKSLSSFTNQEIGRILFHRYAELLKTPKVMANILGAKDE